ncbi:hypothetical protein BH23ACT10_BH23ACT10_08470 [soil metagenome]
MGVGYDALALWRGDPLVDLPDRIAFAPDLAHLDAWRRQLIEDRAELRLAAGDAAAAIPDLERTVAADPLRERAVELLMRAFDGAVRNGHRYIPDSLPGCLSAAPATLYDLTRYSSLPDRGRSASGATVCQCASGAVRGAHTG